MRRVTRQSTRRSGSGLDQINGECGGEVNKVSDHSNASNDAKENGLLHDEMIENVNGGSNGFSGEEHKPNSSTRKKSSNTKTKIPGSQCKRVTGLPFQGQFKINGSSSSATSLKRLGGGGERNVLFSSHKRAQKSKEAANAKPVGRPKKMKNVMEETNVMEEDEYTRISKKLRYLLNRINYEQSLIDAYSLEGWKGSSLEKLRPEKELERATKEILRQKLKIRDLFQYLDTLCAEGNLPESLFDSDGEISSEDIFCAKCGSKDLSIDNDIILCDGFCDRGFHQYCVKPPLLKEDIPPDDESWLCPGCDCKDNSLDLLNYSLGTKLTVSDSWEKIFPEAVAALAGEDQNLNCDLPSDDSDDEEYNPDGLNDKNDEDGCDDNEESGNEDGSSDESDCTFASDEMIGSFKEVKDIMDLPSDDSEDDDYDPDATAHDEDKLQESSNSDSTSDSEDLETSCKGDESNQLDEVSPLEEHNRKLLYDSISESDAGLDGGVVDVPRKRNVARLDYKKLYDEEYENVPSSSDEEDWDKNIVKEDSESADEGNTVLPKQSSNAKDHTSTKTLRLRSKMIDKKDILNSPQEAARENGCSGEKSSSTAYKMKDLKIQTLYKYFQENIYPEKTTQESLAKELQMTVAQVNNWFKNRRSSLTKTMISKEDIEKSKSGKEGETTVAVSSEKTKETYSVTVNNSRASESTNPGGSRKRRRR